MLGRDVVALRRVALEVVELPVELGQLRAVADEHRTLPEDRLPTVGPDRALPEVLEVLHLLARRCVGVGERVRDAHTFERPLLHAVDDRGRAIPSASRIVGVRSVTWHHW